MDPLEAASDERMARVLAEVRTSTTSFVAVCATAFTAAVYSREPNEVEWRFACRGDLGRATAKELERLSKEGRVYWEEGAGDAPTLASPTGPVSTSRLRQLLGERDRYGSRREGHISKADRDQLAAEAAHRCQFTGCGESLLEARAPHSAGGYGYAAHIIAASPNGPRGHAEDSKRLATDPTNVILLCDKHHALVDRIAPSIYTVDRLRVMREQSRERVRRLLDTLSFPVAQTMQLVGSIEGQLGTIDRTERDHALWALGLTPSEASLRLGSPGLAAGQVHTSAFWTAAFLSLRDDMVRIRQAVAETALGPIAFFGVHSTSMLILFGRLLGNAAAVHVLQLHRDAPPGTRWTWPASGRQLVPADEITCVHASPSEGATSCVLVIALTARIPDSDIPDDCLADGAGVYRIEASTPSHLFVRSDEVLRTVADRVDDAFRLMVDDWKVSTIHLIVVAPVSVCVKVGQKLQARHQPRVVSYERLPTSECARGAFAPVIGISATRVTHIASSQFCSLTAEATQVY